MRIFGGCLFGAGAFLLILAGFVGMGSGFGSVANIAGLVVGTALLISGAIFISSSEVIGASNELKKLLVETRDENRLMVGYPLDKIPEIQEVKTEQLSNTVYGMEGAPPVEAKEVISFVFMEETYATEEEAKVARQKFIEKYGRK